MDVDGAQGKETTTAAAAATSSPSSLSSPSSKKGQQQSRSATPSPKPTKSTKETAPATTKPALPQGSGLISNALFGGGSSSSSKGLTNDTTPSAPRGTAQNIVLHIPLNGTTNRIINFARLAEEQYGFAALHPRIAAQRERLARVAAASAALEKKGGGGGGGGESATEEDLSAVDVYDITSDGGGGGDIVMGGTADADADDADDGKKKKKRAPPRRKKVEEYDREDPFVDDTELAWQEHAAASKDGFFVFSGPLIPDSDSGHVEKYLSLSFFIPTWSIAVLACLLTSA